MAGDFLLVCLFFACARVELLLRVEEMRAISDIQSMKPKPLRQPRQTYLQSLRAEERAEESSKGLM